MSRGRTTPGIVRRLAGLGVALGGAIGLCLGLAGCGGGGAGVDDPAAGVGPWPEAPVVLISIDTLRSDRLPAYGFDGVETPALDAIAAESILFERAWSHYPLTLPAHASVMSGLLPPGHGVRDNAGYPVEADALPWLPRLLGEAGWATGGAVSALVLEEATGFADGFEFWDDAVGTSGLGMGSAQRSGDITRERAVAWLEETVAAGERPFLFVHLYEPHTPWEPPEPFASRHADDPYLGEIEASDAIVSRLRADLERLGLWDGALVILFSDHGEGLGDHGEMEHGVLLYREALQVPLMVKLPGGALGGTRVATTAQLADLAPTVLSLVGQPLPDGLDGAPLLDLLAADAPERPIYAETWYPRLHLGWSELTSLVEDDWHLIRGPDPELYDLAADPGETDNRLREERRVYARLDQALEGFLAPLEAPGAVDPETAARLASLGYLSTPSAPAAGDDLPDPKAVLGSLDALHRARTAMGRRDWEGAVELLEPLVAEQPRMGEAWTSLGLSLFHLERLEESIEAYRRAIEVTGAQPRLVARLASLYRDTGRPGDALEIIEATRAEAGDGFHPSVERQLGLVLVDLGRPDEAVAILADNDHPEDRNVLAVAHYRAGRPGEALEVVEGILAADPDNAKALETRGGLELGAGQTERARSTLERAVGLDPELAIAWNSLGVARQLGGDTPGALEAWQRAVAADPTLWDAHYNLGLTAAGAGRGDLARRSLERFVAGAPPAAFARELDRARALLGQLG